MKIYFMYKFSDSAEAIEKIMELRSKGLEVFAFEPKNKYRFNSWKRIARKKIKECNYVCYYFNYNSYINNGKQKNIVWEYNTAQKYGKKVIFIDGSEENKTINELENDEKQKLLLKKLFNESYSEKELNVQLNSFDKTKDLLNKNSTWEAKDSVFQTEQTNYELDKSDYYSLLFNQYKLMVETSETLISRRQTTSNVYTAILAALISLVGSSLALDRVYVTGIIFIAVGFITVSLALNWKSLLIQYDKNNEGKFAVINAIEEKLPANMFDTEYKYNKIKSIVSYASREKALCKIFTVSGIVVSVIGLLLFLSDVL